MLFLKYLPKFVLSGASSPRYLINQSIKSSRDLQQILAVFKSHSQHFDSVHHLFFMQKYLSFTDSIDNHLLSSYEHLCRNMREINNRTFCHFYYLAKVHKLNIDENMLRREVESRSGKFTVDNVNLILLAAKKAERS